MARKYVAFSAVFLILYFHNPQFFNWMYLFCRPNDPVLDLLHSVLNVNLARVPDGRLTPLKVLQLLS